MYRHMLVPIDGSPLSDGAVAKAVDLAHALQARISFFFALPDPAAAFNGELELSRALDPEAFELRREAEAEAILGRARAAAEARGLACAAHAHSAGEPYEAIIEAAGELGCDLILMASHGHRGIKGLLLGSQTQKVLVHSKFPVLVYR